MLLETKNENYLDKVLNEFFGTNSRRVNSNMRTNIKETKEAYIFEIEVPGIKKENIDIKLEDRYLTISISADKETEENYVLKEFENLTQSRSYYVDDLKIEDIKAKLEEGILTLTLLKPKEKEEIVRKITIE